VGSERHINFELELRGIRTPDDLVKSFPKILELIGKEINFIEDRLPQSRESATGPLLAIAGIVGGAGMGTTAVAIAVRADWVNVSAGVLTTITYRRALTNDDHYLKMDLYNNAGDWITSVLPTAQTKSGFKVQPPESGKVKYIAAEFQ